MPLASYKEVLLPHLHQDEYRITSPESDRYNCIAWAAGDATRRWWPGEPDYYWPPDAPQEDALASFQAVFAALGYREGATDEWKPGYEKVALFARDGSHPRRPPVAQRKLDQQAGPLGGHRTPYLASPGQPALWRGSPAALPSPLSGARESGIVPY